MSLDGPIKNTAIPTPPNKKGFHFASDGIHEAMYVLSETIEEAEKIYHATKKKLFGTDNPPPPQSTTAPQEQDITSKQDVE